MNWGKLFLFKTTIFNFLPFNFIIFFCFDFFRYASAGFSFEAGGRTFRRVVSHSVSGTLKPIFESFLIFLLLPFLYLNISWTYWLEDNRGSN